MSFGEDDEILQDFLVEAGEILDLLSEQLVELEQRPDDHNLLNAIFRGFHTVKGGAGFLQLDAMVECCHLTENLFDILRNGKRTVTSELMDVVLQALDTVNSQFQQVSQRQELERAPPELIAQLGRLVSCQDLAEAAASPAPTVDRAEVVDESPVGSAPEAVNPSEEDTPPAAESGGLNLTDEEFEGFLEAISDSPAISDGPATSDSSAVGDTSEAASTVQAPAASEGDEITEDEFDALLDQLHGSGRGPGAAASQPPPNAVKPPPAADSDEITEDEFESLLDQLHGAGKAPKGASVPAAPSSAKPVAAESELITDDEFENLLDQLHGRGKGPTTSDEHKPVQSPTAKQAVPAAGGSGNKAAAAAIPPAGAKAAPPANTQATQAAEAQLSEPSTGAPKPREAGGASGSAPPGVETTVRVDTQRLDDIMNMVGELVLVRNRLMRLGMDSADEALGKAVGNLDVVTADLQSAVMKTRMQPIKKVFGRFPRVVRDLARNLKKEINLELVGEDTDLDKNLVEALADPLVHLVRNSVDHGIELPAQREAAGKSRVGKVVLAAEQEGDHILLTISDDGAGMNPDKLREKAVEKGIMEADVAARLSDTEAFNLIFAPGFSTKTEISDVSGRGVGMDVVKTKITQLNGSIEIQSKQDEGTRFIIKVPLTLAIMPTLMIMLGKQSFALPLVSVNEIFHMDLTKTHKVDGQECVTIRDKAIPVFHLKRWLIKGPRGEQNLAESHVVIVTVGTRRVGFVVDQLVGQEEVVIKPLGKMLQGTPGIAGATITGDGTIALILDVPSLLKRYAGGI